MATPTVMPVLAKHSANEVIQPPKGEAVRFNVAAARGVSILDVMSTRVGGFRGIAMFVAGFGALDLLSGISCFV